MIKTKKSIFLISCILLIFFAGCDDWRDTPLDFNHCLYITNDSDCEVYIYLDETESLHLPNRGDTGTFENISEGWHTIVAFKVNTDGSVTELISFDLAVTERKDYYWTLVDCEPD